MSSGNSCQSWGRYPEVSQETVQLEWLGDDLLSIIQKQLAKAKSILPYGLGRSYGDACLNDGGVVFATRHLNRFISWDTQKGLLRCEAGVSLGEILEFIIPQGWCLPVLPGTQFVTIGGAIANDIHGKNHHRGGTFGQHVQRFMILRSSGESLECSPQQHSELFSATIGGLGLTGLILWAEIACIPVETSYIFEESIRFRSLEEFFAVSEDSGGNFAYTVAWLDCVSRGSQQGRGIFMRGNFARREELPTKLKGQNLKHQHSRLQVPCDAPSFALNRYSVRAFNELYYRKQFADRVRHFVPYQKFFFPLDGVRNWNRIYGARGFFQFQCVLPPDPERRALKEIFQRVLRSGRASFLAVLKEFGTSVSPGLLSFPRPGVTLCLDFPNHGTETLSFLRELDVLVREAGGAIYPAKDACMLPESFRVYFPRHQEFIKMMDPRFSSSFWRRVMG